MQKFSAAVKQQEKKIGFVPTMGYLHEGHLSLVDKAKEYAGVIVVSIFVNPTQFAPNEDFSKYPRNEEQDIKMLTERGVDALFLPDPGEIYQPGYQTYVNVQDLTRPHEGEFRPAHFQGVTTVVSILFNAVLPDIAVFGQKDAQQASVIIRMVNDLKFPVRIVVAPIVREPDGLAMSSRNVYLSPEERKDALVINQALKEAGNMISSGIFETEKLKKNVSDKIKTVNTSSVDYIRIVNAFDFSETANLEAGNEYYILIACRIGKTRLIDNLNIKIPLDRNNLLLS